MEARLEAPPAFTTTRVTAFDALVGIGMENLALSVVAPLMTFW